MIRTIFQVLIILSFFFSGIAKSMSQDTLVLKSGEVYVSKIVLIGKKEISYNLFNDLNGPTYVVKKNSVLKIVSK